MCIKEERYFLIDSENTNLYHFLDEHNVSKKDKIIIFYSNTSKSLSIENLLKLDKFNKKFLKVEQKSKNSMDFNITMYVGYLVGKGRKPNNIFIVSDDNGFKSISTLIKQLEYIDDINFIKTIKSNNKLEVKNNSDKKNEILKTDENDLKIIKHFSILNISELNKLSKELLLYLIENKNTQNEKIFLELKSLIKNKSIDENHLNYLVDYINNLNNLNYVVKNLKEEKIPNYLIKNFNFFVSILNKDSYINKYFYNLNLQKLNKHSLSFFNKLNKQEEILIKLSKFNMNSEQLNTVFNIIFKKKKSNEIIEKLNNTKINNIKELKKIIPDIVDIIKG